MKRFFCLGLIITALIATPAFGKPSDNLQYIPKRPARGIAEGVVVSFDEDSLVLDLGEDYPYPGERTFLYESEEEWIPCVGKGAVYVVAGDKIRVYYDFERYPYQLYGGRDFIIADDNFVLNYYEPLDRKLDTWDKARFLDSLGLLRGFGQATDLPLTEHATRAEVAGLVVHMSFKSHILDKFDPIPFTDVPIDHPYRSEIGNAFIYRIVGGQDSNTFAPDDLITYQDALVMIYNGPASLGYYIKEDSKYSYPNSYIEAGRMNGLIDTEKDPKDYATWGDIIEVLYALYEHEPYAKLTLNSNDYFPNY